MHAYKCTIIFVPQGKYSYFTVLLLHSSDTSKYYCHYTYCCSYDKRKLHCRENRTGCWWSPTADFGNLLIKIILGNAIEAQQARWMPSVTRRGQTSSVNLVKNKDQVLYKSFAFSCKLIEVEDENTICIWSQSVYFVQTIIRSAQVGYCLGGIHQWTHTQPSKSACRQLLVIGQPSLDNATCLNNLQYHTRTSHNFQSKLL
jgi:hypothetical protein